MRWWIKQVKLLWDLDPAKKPGTNQSLCILYASLAIAFWLFLCVLVFLFLEGYFGSVEHIFMDRGAWMSAIFAVVRAFVSLLIPISLIALFLGSIIVLSSEPERSNMGILWRSSLVALALIAISVRMTSQLG